MPLCLVSCLLLGLGTSACGQKGPLYLPSPNTSNASPNTSSATPR